MALLSPRTFISSVRLSAWWESTVNAGTPVLEGRDGTILRLGFSSWIDMKAQGFRRIWNPGDQSVMDRTYLPVSLISGRGGGCDRTPNRSTHDSVSGVDTQAGHSASNPRVFWLHACGNATAPSLSSSFGECSCHRAAVMPSVLAEN